MHPVAPDMVALRDEVADFHRITTDAGSSELRDFDNAGAEFLFGRACDERLMHLVRKQDEAAITGIVTWA